MNKKFLYILLLLITQNIQADEKFEYSNLIESVCITHNSITIVPHQSAEHFFVTPEFIVEYQDNVDISSIDISVATIPFILCIAPSIWITNSHYMIDTMDADLYYTLKRIKKAFQLFYPQFSWTGELIPKQLTYNRAETVLSSDQTALLFSGGLDSTTLSLDLKDKEQLLITIQGVDIPYNDEMRWHHIQNANKSFGAYFGHKNMFIRCNACKNIQYNHLTELSNTLNKWWWWDYILGALHFIGVSIPVLYTHGYKDMYIASSSTINFPYPWNSHPLIDNNVQCSGIAVHHRHEQFTRLEKVQKIIQSIENYDLPTPQLRVCWRDKDGGNCCSCINKCLMTIHDILAEGQQYQPFGFPISFEKLQEITKKAFDGTQSYNSEIIDDWCDIQDRIRQVLTGNTNVQYKPELHDYMQWLATIDLRGLCKNNLKELEKQKSFFTALWHLGQQSPSDTIFDKTL